MNIRRLPAFFLASGASSLLVISLLMVYSNSQAADKLDKVIDTEAKTAESAAASQQRIDKLDDQNRSMLEQYRQASWRAEQLKTYHLELQKLLSVQNAEIADLEAQLKGVGSTHPEMQPLMLNMVNSLEKFIALDLPFDLEARNSRITLLREALADGTTGLAEKFRKVLEAYQIELAYGREIDVSQISLPFAGGDREVELLRLGRTMLYYRTLDGEGVGYWDRNKKSWQPLPVSYRKPIRRAILVAKETATTELLMLPIEAAKAAESTDLPGTEK